jgi:hypothetical protein
LTQPNYQTKADGLSPFLFSVSRGLSNIIGPKGKSASLLLSPRRDGAQPRRRRLPSPLLPLPVLLPHPRSNHPTRSRSPQKTGFRLGLPSAGCAGHRGPRRRAVGDDAAGTGAAGAQGMLPQRPEGAAMDAPRAEWLRQVHPA